MTADPSVVGNTRKPRTAKCMSGVVRELEKVKNSMHKKEKASRRWPRPHVIQQAFGQKSMLRGDEEGTGMVFSNREKRMSMY